MGKKEAQAQAALEAVAAQQADDAVEQAPVPIIGKRSDDGSDDVVEIVDGAVEEVDTAAEPAEPEDVEEPVSAAPVTTQLGPCCWLGLCCPPQDAAVALGYRLEAGAPAAGDLTADETYVTIAARILTEFRLVPRELTPEPSHAHGSMANAATHRLTALNEHVRKELLDILPGLGYEEIER